MKTKILALALSVIAGPLHAQTIEMACTAEQMTEPPWPLIIDMDLGVLRWPDDVTPMKFNIVSTSEATIIAVGDPETNLDEVISLNRTGNPSIWALPPSEGQDGIWMLECFRTF